ncbi:response regulator [Marinomonas sp. M1K-6]|uniref:histidine kinase n=1 Tax=Marinomonas profundi TaxID=2726122 RepID=A0A847R837_9GAMM|nr:response regulator [Marinomonas profundi]NLQ18236.1 response regulator [Marinomonas profundi]UDV03588.1 response regulator [Marinomonas profundi]
MKQTFSFSSLSLSSTLFLAIFVPVFIVSLISSFFLLTSRFNDLEQSLRERTQYITEQVATASEYAIVFSDQNMMHRILQNALNNENISNIQLINTEQKVIAELGKTPASANEPLSNTPYIKEFSDRLESASAIYYANSSPDSILNSQTGLFNSPNQRNLIGWVKVEASKSVVQIKKYQYASAVLFFFSLFNIMVLLGAFHLSKTLTYPINRLSSALSKLVKGQFSTTKLIKLPPEYASLQKDLLDLTERLEHHNEELIAGIEQSTEDIRRSMDSLEEKSAQLHIANREATESNRLKSQFLANISHEVRTPLNAILGYTKTLQKDITDTQQRLYVDTIEQSTNSLLAIIGDILDFSKIEAGKLNLESHHFNIKTLIDEVYQTLSINLLTKEKKIDLIPEFSTELPEWFIGDSTRVRQILTNLIGNAIKFTHQGSVRTKVAINSHHNNEVILSFQIIDSGIGIPEHKINRLFKPFSQVDTSTTRQFGGTGLGLVITKKLVEQMHGKIEVSSDPGIGSTFHFTLTLKPSLKQNHNKDALQRHVVLMEPSINYRNYLISYLESIGVRCTICSDLEHIIATINQQNTTIDAILLSVTTDEKDRLETKELIRHATTQYGIASILMIQPPSQIAHLTELKNICAGILLKPISRDRLYSTLKDSTLKEINAPTAHIAVNTSPLASERIKGQKILAVDDTPVNLQLLKHWLIPAGLEITLAYSGQQAIDLAAQEKFDLIFMDIQMPEMDGMETSKQLRKLDGYENTPIIALTAHALGSEQQQILASGMNAYLTKPIDEEILLSTIDTWCSNTHTLQDQINSRLEGIFDLEKALSIVDGKVDIAKDIFTMFADTLDEEKKLIQHHLEQQDTKKLIEVVHRIHGAAKYTGTINIARHAGFLETHLKELAMEDAEGVAEDFIDAIDELLSHRQLIPWTQALDSSTTKA